MMAVTKAAYRRYVNTMKALSEQAQRELMAMWPMLDKSSPEALKRDLERAFPYIVDIYGRASSVISARFYEIFRDGEKGEYVAMTIAERSKQTAYAGIGYALSDSFTGGSVTEFLSGVLDEAVKGYGRETMMLNASNDPFAQGYQSIPEADACAFCMMKAIDTYHNYNGQKLDAIVDTDAWHANCNCQLVPIFEEYPEWAGFDKLWDEYQAARAQAHEDTGTSAWQPLTAKEVMAGWRKANGLEH